jgi:hypothetical protein
MQLQANQISRDWTVLHDGRKFYVNYTQSDTDSRAIALMGREKPTRISGL